MKGYKCITLEAALRPVQLVTEESSSHSTMDSGVATPAKYFPFLSVDPAKYQSRLSYVIIRI